MQTKEMAMKAPTATKIMVIMIAITTIIIIIAAIIITMVVIEVNVGKECHV